MSRFLRFCAFLSVLFFTTNVFAAGYSCPTYKKYTSCSAGYYMTNSSGTTYNGTPAVGNLCTICPKGYYCTGGTANKLACSAGRYGSSTGLRTSACSGVIAAGRYGSAGATSANGSGAVSAGYYSSGGGTKPEPTEAGNGCLRGYKCGKVSTGCYGSAGAATDCPNGCPAGYQAGEGTTAQSNCLASCAAGTRVATANAACTAITSGNVYMLAHTVKYGQTSEEATRCPSSYTIGGTTQADHDAKEDCKITCSAGTRVTTPDATCSSISGSTGYYITSHTVSAGLTSPAATQCPENYRSGAGTTSEANCSLTTTAGKYVAAAGAGETACISPYYCPGGTTIKYGTGTTTGGNSACTDLGAIYSKSDAGASAGTNCYATTTSTKWVASAKASSESTCTAGYYCAGGTKVYYNSTGGRTECGGGKYSAEGATSCSNITAGCYGTSASSSCPAVCGANKYSDAGASACTACDSDYANSGNTAESHAGVASCKVTCAAGTYVASSGAACTDVGSGYYTTASQTISQGSTGSRSACSSLNAFYTASDGGRDATTDCFGTTTSGKFVKTAKSGEETCAAGGYCPGSVKVYYNSTGGRTACGAGTANANTGSSASSACLTCAAGTYSTGGASSCSTVNDGCYGGASATSACPNSCSSLNSFYTKSDSGRDANTDCYGTTTSGNWIKTQKSGQVTCDAGGYCPGSVKVYYNSTGGRTGCGAGKYNASTGSSSSSACANITAGCYGTSASSACPAVCATNKWSAEGASSCTSCPTDYENSGDTAASHANQSSCKITVDGGYYIGTAGDNSSNWDKCAGGTYKASHTVAYGGTSSCATCSAGYYCPEGASGQTECGGNTKYSSSGAASCSTVSTGYYTTGGTSTTRTGQTKCEAGNYCSGGVKTECGGGKYSAAGATSCSNITAGCYGTSASSECPAVCAANTYSDAGASACTACDSDYANSGDTAESHAGVASCKVTCAAGTYVASSGAACTDVGSGYYTTASQTISQGSTGSRSACSSLNAFYTASDGGRDATTDCFGTTTSGKFVKTAKSGEETGTAGGYCAGSVKVYYNSTGGRTACGAGTANANTGSSSSSACLTCAAGTYNTTTGNTTCSSCPAGSYCTGGSNKSACAAPYSSSAEGSDDTNDCYLTTSSTKYVAEIGKGEVTCAAGGYCPGGSTIYRGGTVTGRVTTGGRTACGAGKYNASTGSSSSSACSNITAGCYGTSATTACPAVCAANKWSAAGASSCTSCPTDYENSGDTSASHANQSSCKITVDGGYYIGTAGDNSSNWDKCSAGYYKAAHNVAYGSTSSCSECGAVNKYSAAGASACSTVDTGYYTTGGTTTTRTGQSQCKSGTYCTGGVQNTCPSGYGASAAGSDAAADCYMSVAATKYVKAANDSSASACGTGTYKAAHTVYYGGTSTCSSCPSGYDDGAAVATQAECVISVAGGKYVGTPNSATLSTCAGGTYKAAHSVAYGSTSSCGQCPANSYCPEGASKATACSTLASGFYPNSAAGSDAATDCKTNSLSGKYVASKNATSATNCAGGTYKGSHQVNYGSTSSCGQCPANSYCPAGASAATACSTLASGFYPNSAAGSDAATDCKTNSLSGKYVASKNATSATSCAAGTFKGAHIVNYGSTSSCDACALGSYSAAGASTCTACQSGKTTSGTGKSSCDATCENNNSYASTWATATWSDNAVANLCQIATCAGGSRYTSANGEATGTLPSGYTQLAYLESTGTQYIDTGIVYARFVHDIQFTNQASTGSLMGKSAGGGMYWGQARSGSAGYEGPGGAIRNIDPTDRHIVEFGALAGQRTYLNIGDTTITGSTNASSSTYSLLGISGYEMYRCEAKLYDVKAYDENDALISHLIPVRRNSDGVLGMYDTVNNRFLVNAGSGTFVAGFAILKSQNTCTQCSAGTYSAGGTAPSCGQCPANSYCPAGASAATACSTLASGFYPNSAAGSGAATDCKTNSLSGKYVASANATSATTCSCGTYKEAHTVAYGSTSSCTTTSAGYYAAEGASSQTQADPGYYAAAGACEQTKIQAGCFGGEGSASACPNSCPAAESGWTLASTTGLKVVTDCAEITTPSTSGSPIATICTAGTLTKKATNSTTWGSATASGLTAKAGRYVNGTTCSACSAGTYTSSATTKTSCTPAAAGYYVSGTGATSQTACPAGTYQGSTGKTSCSDAAAGTYTTGCKDTTNNKACTGTSVCADGKYSDKKASSCTACTTAKGYTNSGTTAASHAGAASCKVTCGAGQYVASAGAGCVNVGVDTTTNTGYWGAGGTVAQTATLARNKCDTGLITTGSGTGANEAGDCGRKLHAGDNVIYLRSAERTSPSLRVKVGDKTFFGALSTALSGALKVKNGSTTYSVVNDWQ